jgi:hypothetical protein
MVGDGSGLHSVRIHWSILSSHSLLFFICLLVGWGKSSFTVKLGSWIRSFLLVFPVFSRVFSIQLHISQASPSPCRRPPPVIRCVQLGRPIQKMEREGVKL